MDNSNIVEPLVEKLHLLNDDPSKKAMSPYERMNAAMTRHEPDRVPFDFWAVSEMIEKLKRFFSFQDEEELLRILGIDCRIVYPDETRELRDHQPDGTYYNYWGTHRMKVHNEFATYDEYASYPLSGVHSVAEVEQFSRWPQPDDFNWASLPAKIKKLNKDTRYYIRYDIGGIFETAWGLYGLDKFLVDLIERPEIPRAIMDCITEILINNFRQVMEHSEGLIDMVYTYDDIAIQRGLLMSKRMWRENILHFHLRLNKAIKEHDIKILYHSCGAVYSVIDELIEMGIDALNPLQPRAAHMDMQKIKHEFGARVSFHGGIDIQETLPFGSVQDVENEVRERCEILGKNGGYICTAAHYIQADTPVENVLTMYATDRTV